MKHANFHGIVAGDIIDSSELSSEKRRRLDQLLTEAHDTVGEAFGEDLPYPLAVSAGDEWRMYIERPSRVLAAAIAFWTSLKARDLNSRMVVAVGEVDFIDQGDLNRADGTALRCAGRRLHEISEDADKFGLFIPARKDEMARLWMETTSELTNILLDDLTSSQARAVTEMICGVCGTNETPTLKEIAARWKPRPVTAQTVSKHLQRARWPSIDRTLQRFEDFWDYW